MPEETVIRPEPIVTSEAPTPRISAGEVAQPYQMLGRALDKAGEGLEHLATPLAERAGYQAVTTDDQGNMTVSRLPIFGPAGAAYSRALKYSALAQADGLAKRADIEISKQYPNNPEGYLSAANQYRDKLVAKTADSAGPEVAASLSRAIDETTTFNYRRLASEQQATIKRNFEKDTQWIVDSNKENLIGLVKSGGLETPEGQKKAKEYVATIDHALQERSNNPILAAPKSESDAVHTELGRDIQSASWVYQNVTKPLQSPAAPYQASIESSAGKYNLDPTLLARQLWQESKFKENAVSPAGAQGIAQFMPATARRYGVDVRSPQSSIEGAAHYMSDLMAQFGGNTGLALAGYNWGEGNVAKWMASGANPNAMPRETRNYIEAITGQPIEAWLRGERPSTFQIQNLPAQYSTQGGGQKALDNIEAMRTNQSFDPVQRQLNVERGLAAYKDWHDDITRRTNLAAVGQKAADENFENAVIADHAGNQPMINENQIMTQPGVSAEARLRMLRWTKQEDMPEPMPRVSQRNAIDAFNRMGLDPGNPSRISSISQIRDMYGRGMLTKADEEWLEKKFSDMKSPEGERLADVRKQFSAAALQAIDHSNPLAGKDDPDGKLRAYSFERMADAKVAQYRAAGKDPFDLFDPTKPDYLGKPEILQQYQPTLQESVAAQTGRLLRGATPPPPGGSTVPPVVTTTQAAPANPRLPGETPQEYLKRIGAP